MPKKKNYPDRLHCMVSRTTTELLAAAKAETGLSEARIVRDILEAELPTLLRELGAMPISYAKRTRMLVDTARTRPGRDELQPAVEWSDSDLAARLVEDLAAAERGSIPVRFVAGLDAVE